MPWVCLSAYSRMSLHRKAFLSIIIRDMKDACLQCMQRKKPVSARPIPVKEARVALPNCKAPHISGSSWPSTAIITRQIFPHSNIASCSGSRHSELRPVPACTRGFGLFLSCKVR